MKCEVEEKKTEKTTDLKMKEKEKNRKKLRSSVKYIFIVVTLLAELQRSWVREEFCLSIWLPLSKYWVTFLNWSAILVCQLYYHNFLVRLFQSFGSPFSIGSPFTQNWFVLTLFSMSMVFVLSKYNIFHTYRRCFRNLFWFESLNGCRDCLWA